MRFTEADFSSQGSQSQPDRTSCSFNGQSYPNGSIIKAFLSSTVPNGQTCTSEERRCVDGTLSGSYLFASCAPNAPAACLFNGRTVASGSAIKGYQQSSVPFGQTCVSEDRTCTNGILSGTYNFETCNVGGAASCLFNGQSVAHGASVRAYTTSTVPYGSVCQESTRVCNNGVLSGTGSYATCSVNAPASCLFNGQTIPHGGSVKGYQNPSVPFGQSCVSEDRNCANGNLGGSYSFASCSAGAPSSCLFNGQTIAHGQSVTAYASSSVASGQSCVSQSRICNNGALSGSYAYSSCSVNAPASCLFNGQTIAHGQSVTAYASSSVSYGGSCSGQTRTCNNGLLSGSYNYASCSMESPLSCYFNGQTIAHGQNVTAYASSSVAPGQSCSSQTRTCNNGSLSGSYLYSNCTVSSPVSCYFNGQTIPHGSFVTAYAANSVPYAQTCQSEIRSCNNGTLSGSYGYSSCSTQNAAPCNYPGGPISWGAYGCSTNVPAVTLAHGETRSVASTSSTGDGIITYSCSNGNFQEIGNTCTPKGCGKFDSATKCQVYTYCANGRLLYAQEEYPITHVDVSAPVGQTVEITQEKISFLDPSITLTRWDRGLIFKCEATGWKALTNGSCAVRKTVPDSSDRNCTWDPNY